MFCYFSSSIEFWSQQHGELHFLYNDRLGPLSDQAHGCKYHHTGLDFIATPNWLWDCWFCLLQMYYFSSWSRSGSLMVCIGGFCSSTGWVWRAVAGPELAGRKVVTIMWAYFLRDLQEYSHVLSEGSKLIPWSQKLSINDLNTFKMNEVADLLTDNWSDKFSTKVITYLTIPVRLKQGHTVWCKCDEATYSVTPSG